MIYSFGWLALVIISLAVSLIAFIWGLGNGQFSEQGRARYLPLRDQLLPVPVKNPTKPPRGIYVLLVIIASGFLILMMPIVLTFLYA